MSRVDAFTCYYKILVLDLATGKLLILCPVLLLPRISGYLTLAPTTEEAVVHLPKLSAPPVLGQLFRKQTEYLGIANVDVYQDVGLTQENAEDFVDQDTSSKL